MDTLPRALRATSWWMRRAPRRIRHRVCRALQKDPGGGCERTAIVAGTGRSGTTLLAEVVDAVEPGRLLFEPFDPRAVEAYADFEYFQYLRPGDDRADLEAFCRRVLEGRIRHPRVDRYASHLRPQRRIVKTIRALLFLGWLSERFPDTPVFFIIRHPCAVVLSRMRLGWATDDDIGSFLAQPALIADFLGEHLDRIRGLATDEEKHALIWSISNLVPLRQVSGGKLHVVFFEKLMTEPEQEIRRLCARLGSAYRPSLLRTLGRPSSTAQPASRTRPSGRATTSWRSGLDDTQIGRILGVVRDLGLGDLYDEGFLPLDHGARG